jgi:enoyl-CoA hydratase
VSELARVDRESDGAVALVTVNRPDARNALDAETVDALAVAFEALERDAAVRCAILTGAGDRAFVAGADIKAMAGLDADGARRFSERGHRLGVLLEGLRLPVIAAVNGFALGAGCELALACDFIYASRAARLGFPEVGLGVIPGFGGTQRLASRVGAARARELVYTGRVIDADEGLRIGLVNAVTEPAELLSRCRSVAVEIAAKAPLAVAAAKHTIPRASERRFDAGLGIEREAFAGLFATADQKEGMRAFVEKRPPRWTGR